jgi:hypothetical protein
VLSGGLYKYISKYRFFITELRPKIRQLIYYIMRLYSLNRSIEVLVMEIDASRVGARVGS